MNTTHDTPSRRHGRLPAQLLAVAALACAMAGFFTMGVAGFLLAATGVVLAAAAAVATPDGWLVDDGQEAP